MSIVTNIFIAYSVHFIPVYFQKFKIILSKGKDTGESVHKSRYSGMQIMIAKTMTLQMLCVHDFSTNLYMVLFHMLDTYQFSFFPKCYIFFKINYVSQLLQNVKWGLLVVLWWKSHLSYRSHFQTQTIQVASLRRKMLFTIFKYICFGR